MSQEGTNTVTLLRPPLNKHLLCLGSIHVNYPVARSDDPIFPYMEVGDLRAAVAAQSSFHKLCLVVTASMNANISDRDVLAQVVRSVPFAGQGYCSFSFNRNLKKPEVDACYN